MGLGAGPARNMDSPAMVVAAPTRRTSIVHAFVASCAVGRSVELQATPLIKGRGWLAGSGPAAVEVQLCTMM
jgi:hypothetical protein